jgi:hypothetical protein
LQTGPAALLSLAHLGGDSQSGGKMLPIQGSAQDIENTRIALVLIMTGIVFFWRVLLRMLLVMVVVAIGVGALVILQSVHP